jgi:hypothetical protein
MAKVVKHRKIRIITLEEGETVEDHCNENDIALVNEETGWWIYFVGENGEISGYDEPFESSEKAMWTAKAAAEFASE